MHTIELTCPNCEQVLMLDAGFAGGVCRCASCGTLMTVPESQPAQHPGPKHRPSTPGGPNESTPTVTRPTGNLLRPEPTPSIPVIEPTPPTSPLAPDQHVQTTGVEKTGVNRSGGRPQRANVPINKRLAIYSVLACILFLVTSVIVFAIRTLFEHQTLLSANLDQRPPIVVAFDYDPDTNPFQADKPNFLGLPLRQQTAVVISTPANSSHWLGLVKDALMTGTDFDTEAVAIQLVFTNPEHPAIFPAKPTPMAHLERTDMRNYLNSNLAFGETDPVPAIQIALASQPVQLILVTGENFLPEQSKAIQALLENWPNTQFDVVLIGIRDSQLQQLAIAYNGKCIDLAPQKLSDWRYDTY